MHVVYVPFVDRLAEARLELGYCSVRQSNSDEPRRISLACECVENGWNEQIFGWKRVSYHHGHNSSSYFFGNDKYTNANVEQNEGQTESNIGN